MKRIYIAGCGGMLGEAFYRKFKDDFTLKCTDIDVNEAWLSYLDFRDFEKYRKDVSEFKPDFLFHIGAHTNLEYCEENPDDAYVTNTLAVENAVYIANELDIPILYISTAGIFDGKKKSYDDWDLPNPLCVYAKSKYYGERFVIENAKRYLICRPGWMIGGGPKKDKKFIGLLMKQLKEGKKELFLVTDKEGTPTYTCDFVENVRLLMEKEEFFGLYNMSCNGNANRLEVAKELIKILDLEKEVKITPVTSDYFKETFFVSRPSSETLINKKLDLRGLNLMKNWKTALKEYIEEYYKEYL